MFTRLAALAFLMFVGVATWIIGSKLSADAIGMGVGVVFGALAGIPTALLLLASQRRSNDVQPGPPPAPRNAPPVIIVAGGTRQSLPYDPYGGRQGYAPALPGSRSPRLIKADPYRYDDYAEFDREDW